MKVNFNTPLLMLNGTPIQWADGDKLVGMQLKHAAIEALMSQSNSLPDGDQKFAAYQLAERIFKAKAPLDMTPEDVTSLKQKIGTQFGAHVVGPAFKALNG
jgi:hypothetical protein